MAGRPSAGSVPLAVSGLWPQESQQEELRVPGIPAAISALTHTPAQESAGHAWGVTAPPGRGSGPALSTPCHYRGVFPKGNLGYRYRRKEEAANIPNMNMNGIVPRLSTHRATPPQGLCREPGWERCARPLGEGSVRSTRSPSCAPPPPLSRQGGPRGRSFFFCPPGSWAGTQAHTLTRPQAQAGSKGVSDRRGLFGTAGSGAPVITSFFGEELI